MRTNLPNVFIQQNYQQYGSFKLQYLFMSLKIVPLLITALALYFYYYMTGVTGIVILLIVFILLNILMYLKQNMILYQPVIPGANKSPANNPRGQKHPSEHDMESIDLTLNTSDLVVIRGWHMKAKVAKRLIIYFHENAGNIGTRLHYVKNYVKKLDCDLIMVAYRGYSDSQSTPSEQGLIRDSQAVMEYAVEYSVSNGDLPIYVLGRSLGGAVAVNLCSREQYKNIIQGVILENTFTSIADMIDSIFPYLRYFKYFQKNHWRSIDLIQKLTAPILFIKSMKDELVPPQHMHKLMRRAQAPSKEYQIANGAHNAAWTVDSAAYFSKILEFFQESQKNQSSNQKLNWSSGSLKE